MNDSNSSGPGAAIFSLQPRGIDRVAFDRTELQIILTVYGRQVARGEWRDYAMDFGKEKAVFAIFRRTSEMPLFKIEKSPKLAGKQGIYAVVSAAGQVLKRGHELTRVLMVLEKPARIIG